MSFPDFFEQVPAIRMHDPLSWLLGATSDGMMDYRYGDAVRLAGHSCPTVASAWLMARAAVKALYPDGPGERGGIAVRMPAPEDQGVTGVVAQVLTLITGAAAGNGFKGLNGNHARNRKLFFAAEDIGASAVVFERCDTGQSVSVDVDLSGIAPHPDMPTLAGAVMQGVTDAEQVKAFGVAWQDRVKRLLEQADNPEVVQVNSVREQTVTA